MGCPHILTDKKADTKATEISTTFPLFVYFALKIQAFDI